METQTNKSKHIEYRGVDPRNIHVVSGFNVRTDFNTPEDEELKNDIIKHGVKVALVCRKRKGEEYYELIDGERRWRATMKAIEEGHDIKLVPIKPFTGNMEDALLEMFQTGAFQKKYNQVEQAEVVKRFSSYGYTVAEIATKLSRSIPTIQHLLDLSSASKEIKDKVIKDEISGRTVSNIMRASAGEEEAKEMVDEAIAQANGKRATAKNVKKLKKETPKDRVELILKAIGSAGEEVDKKKLETLQHIIFHVFASDESPIQAVEYFKTKSE